MNVFGRSRQQDLHRHHAMVEAERDYLRKQAIDLHTTIGAREQEIIALRQERDDLRIAQLKTTMAAEDALDEVGDTRDAMNTLRATVMEDVTALGGFLATMTQARFSVIISGLSKNVRGSSMTADIVTALINGYDSARTAKRTSRKKPDA